MNNSFMIVDQKLQSHDLVGAIECAIKEADKIKTEAQSALAGLEERSCRLKDEAERVLAKYPLL